MSLLSLIARLRDATEGTESFMWVLNCILNVPSLNC